MSTHKKYTVLYLVVAMMLTTVGDLFLDGVPKAVMAIASLAIATFFVYYVADLKR